MTLPLFLIPMLAGLMAQALKPLLNHQGSAHLQAARKMLPRYGGMPSAHASFISSLAVVVAATDGIGSATFAIAAALVILVLDDALRLRIFIGQYGAALQELIAELPPEKKARFPYVESRLGHKPLEVVVGGALGGVISLLLLILLR